MEKYRKDSEKLKEAFGSKLQETENESDKLGSHEQPFSQTPLYYQIFDTILLAVENLLAFRVVLSFLGASSNNIVNKLTQPFVLPFYWIEDVLSLKTNNSTLELLPVILVFLLVILHSYLDRNILATGKRGER